MLAAGCTELSVSHLPGLVTAHCTARAVSPPLATLQTAVAVLHRIHIKISIAVPQSKLQGGGSAGDSAACLLWLAAGWRVCSRGLCCMLTMASWVLPPLSRYSPLLPL